MLAIAKNNGIDISHCIDDLVKYAEILVEYNKKVNLTAILQPEEIEIKHFLDSLIFANNEKVQGKVIDVGTGAGFPGVVAKLFKPEIDLTLLEPTGKRVEFLKYLCKELNIEATVIKERAEEAARKQWREVYDVAAARAVAPLNILCEYCLPLVKVGGCFIALKAEIDEELVQARKAISTLDSKVESVEKFTLPDDSTRCLVIIKKISQNSSVYPRNGGRIKKSPL